MGILNRWRQFGKRYFWPHLLLGVVAASIGVPSVLVNTEQQTLSTVPTSVNRLNSSVQSISVTRLWQNVSSKPVDNLSPWHQQAIRRFLNRLAFAMAWQSESAFVSGDSDFHEFNVYEWSIVDSLTSLLVSTHVAIPLHSSVQFADDDRLTGKKTGLWLVKQGGLRAGPI